MKYHYDLHIHSILSPDADVLMTPNNIFNMAYLKKLNVIAVTDHNSTKQLSICEEIAKSYDILFIPGIELSLKDDFHVLVYFKSVEDANTFNEKLNPWRSLKRYDGVSEHSQGFTDINDLIVGHETYDLSLNLSLSLNDLKQMLQSFRHILVFAHVNRQKKSGLHVLKEHDVDAIEVVNLKDINFIKNHKLEHYKIMYNSDAHDITDLNECMETNIIDLKELTMDAFFEVFHHG
ncbi:MAG TPA: histidinol-phosphatase [Acholeplasmataceae bacterium]|nr:histidinol-phosphatase [Acholeplasmataceae bacterium]